MKRFLKLFLLSALLFVLTTVSGQSYTTVVNAHSHNDYLRNVPFYTAYSQRFASIEADIFAVDGELFVAHDREDITPLRTFRALYLEPIVREMKLKGEKGYPEGSGFQLLIDLKTGYEETLPLLQEQLMEFRECFDTRNNPSAVRVVISGARPEPRYFGDFDDIIWFDGRLDENYTPEQKERVAMMSLPFSQFSKWNGLGRMVHPEYDAVKAVVDKVHSQGMKIRFWGCPDTKTTWNCFIKLGVDYLNTDKPEALAQFLAAYKKNSYTVANRHAIYTPALPDGNSEKKPKNIILLISDGGGINHLWAAATVNGGMLNILKMKNIGLLKNDPLDDYTTDSAGAGSALATGRKSRNRHIGTDTLGNPVRNIVELLAGKGMRTAIITNDGITGATPAAFYAHQDERDKSLEISYDLLESPADIIVGSCEKLVREPGSLKSELNARGVAVVELAAVDRFDITRRAVCHGSDDKAAGFRVIEDALPKVLSAFSSSSKGFFIMAEGAKIDKGGHANDMETVVDEYLSFDKVVGKALEFADKNKETLVIVVSDHETGGLTLIDGDYRNGKILGDFSTPDHTGTPVLLFAYGASARKFCGFDEIVSIYEKIRQLLK